MFKIAFKDLKLFRGDKRSVLLTFLLPIVLISLFALAYGGAGGSNDTNPIEIYGVDQDNTNYSQEIMSKLDSLKGLNIEMKSMASAKEGVTKGKKVGMLVFYKGFKDSVDNGKDAPMELLYDQSREIEAGLLQQVLISNLVGMIGKNGIKQKIFNMIDKDNPGLSKKEKNDIFSKIDEQVDRFDMGSGNKDTSGGQSDSAKVSFMGLKTTKIFAKSENNLGLVQAVAGTAIMMLLFSVSGIGSGMLLEKEEGTLKKLLYSPVNPNTILFGKLISALFVAIIQLTVMFIFTWLVFGLNIFENVPGLILMILSTAFAAAGFGVLIASICTTRKQVESISTIIILIMSAIGGSMMPVFIMPAIMQKLAMFSVNYWSIQGFYDIYWRHLPLADVSIKAGILVIFGIVTILVSLGRFKKNILSIA